MIALQPQQGTVKQYRFLCELALDYLELAFLFHGFKKISPNTVQQILFIPKQQNFHAICTASMVQCSCTHEPQS
jgi:hypothetical protein